MKQRLITRDQMKRLQVLYSQFARRSFDSGDGGREARLAWASQLVGHPVSSFSDLSVSDARHLIDVLQGQLGVKQPSQRLGQEDAARHGKDGRYDGDKFRSSPQMVSGADLAVIEDFYSRLGWTRDRFDAWLRSPTSPLKKSAPTIRTKAEANRVRWALKGMLQSRGLWEERG